MGVKSVFSIGSNRSQKFITEGYGQVAATTAVDAFPLQRVVFEGFMINDSFKKADLTPHWERNHGKK